MDLPDDIVREIFLQVADLSGPALLPPHSREPRMVISHVCTTWRRVALNTAQLWNEVVIDDPATDDRSVADGPGRLILKTWFARSRQRLLSLEIARIFHGLRPLFDEFVFPNLHRCRKLKLEITFPLMHQLFHSPGLLYHLEDLEVEIIGAGVQGTRQDIMDHEPITSFHVASRLHRVVLYLDQPRLDLPRLNLQWQQLTVLAIRGSSIPANRCLDALRKCTSLEECEVSVAGTAPANDSWSFHHPVILPSLHSIQLASSSNYDGLSQFLAALHLPGLRRFRPIVGIANSLPVLQLFLAPASNELEELDMSGNYWSSAAELRAFLVALPNLSVLRFPTSVSMPSTVLQDLATGSINPRLTSIQFGLIAMDLLLCFLEVRLLVAQRSGGTISKITSVLTYWSRPTGGAEHARWTSLQKAGVEFHCYRWV